MKRRMTLSLVLTLSVLLALVSLPSMAQAEPPARFRFATGVVTPGVGQILRITVNAGAGNDTVKARFRWAQYMAAGCSGMPAVCRQTVESQGATPVVMLGNDALSFDVPGNGNGVNVSVESNSRAVHVNALIIDTATSEVVVGWKVEAGEK